MEFPVCRFCLENTSLRDNELIAPCRCKGSVEFVHKKCLLKWYSLAPLAIADICQLCRVPYNCIYLRIEVFPNENGFLYQFLICPYIITFSFKYLCFLYSGFFLRNYENAIILIQYHQILIHSLYFYLFYRKVFVQNHTQYRRHFTKGYRVFLILSHLFFWAFSYSSENLLFLYFVDIFLPFYWHTHLRCLTEINAMLID
jgi:hypothetical protein